MANMLRAGLAAFILMTVATASAASPLLAADQGRSVRVTVVGTDGLPVAEAVVQLIAPGATEFSSGVTNRRGQISFPTAEGFSYWLRVWATGYAVGEQPYVPASDGPAVTLRLTPYRADLVGLVTDHLGSPVSGVRVQAWREGLGLQAEALTDETGAYVMQGLTAAGAYRIQATARGFLPVVQQDLALAPGARNQADLGLTPVTGKVTGELIDSRTGGPVAGATVDLVLTGWGVIVRGATDELGSFDLAVPPWANGTYQVRITAAGYETATAGPVQVTAGGWTDYGGTNRISLNPLYAELTGTVLDGNGAAPGATIVELQRSGVGTIETAAADDNGFFAFEKLPAGTYRVRALPTQNLHHGATPWVTLSGGERATADVAAPSPDLAGYGQSAIVGTVRDHLGNPLPGVRVLAYRGNLASEALTDARGRYRIAAEANMEDAIDPKTSTGYHVTVALRGYIPSDQQDTADGTPAPAVVNVRAKATNRADFTLQPASAELAGRVLDDRGLPVGGAAVVLLEEGKGEVARATTDGTGRYRFPGREIARQARVLAAALERGYYESSIAPDGSLAAPATLPPGAVASQMIRVRPTTGQVMGLVRAGTDRPAAGAAVRIIRPADGKEWVAPVSDRGTFAVTVPNGPADQYLVGAGTGAADTGTAGTAVSLAANRGVTVNLATVPDGAIRGTVYTTAGQPAAGVPVSLWAEGENGPMAEALSDEAGNFHFQELAPGRRYSVASRIGPVTVSGLAPGEPVLTPLVLLQPGETVWTDLLILEPER